MIIGDKARRKELAQFLMCQRKVDRLERQLKELISASKDALDELPWGNLSGLHLSIIIDKCEGKLK